MAEQTDPLQPEPPVEGGEGGEAQRSSVDTLAEAQALAALDEMIAKMDSVGEANGSAAGPARAEGQGQEAPPDAYALTGDVPPMDGWYVAMKDNAQGPLTVDDLKERWSRGEIGADTLCWREGMSEWRQLSRLHALTTAIVPRPREGLKALSSKPPVRTPSSPSSFAPSASKMLKSLADQEREAQTDRLVGAVRVSPATPAAPMAARQPTSPTTPEGPKRVQPPAVKPPMFSAERGDEDEDEEVTPRRAAGVSGAKLFFSLFAASVLGGVVGGYVVKVTMPPPAPVIIHEPMPTAPPPPAPPPVAVQPPTAPPAEPPKVEAPVVKVKPAAKPPVEGPGDPAAKQPPAPKKQPPPPPPKNQLDKDFQDTFGQ